MPNKEWSKRFISTRDKFGGSVAAEGYDGRSVISGSRFGEFAWKMSDTGEFMVDFPDKGIGCVYLTNGKLGAVLFEMSIFFGNLSEEELDGMANSGKNVRGLLEVLQLREEELFFSVLPTTREIKAILLDRNSEEQGRREEQFESFAKGLGGKIKLDGNTVDYQVIQQGDEISISLGEVEEERLTVIPVSVASFLDLSRGVGSKNPRTNWALADRILLNRK